MEALDDSALPDEPSIAEGGVETLREYRRLLRAARSDYANPSCHLDLGRFYLKLARRSQAYSAFRAAKSLQPGNPTPYRFLARLYREDDELEKAKGTWLQLLGHDPGQAEAHLEVGRLYHQLGDLPRCVAALAEATRLAPDSTDAYRLLASLAVDAGETERALGYLGHLKALTPSDPEVFALSARSHRQRGATDRAILDLKRAVELAPEDSALRLELAGIYLDEGLPNRALEVLQPYLAAGAPPHAEALLAGARAREALGQVREAEALVVRFHEGFPQDPRGPLLRARRRAAAGDPEGAEAHFRAADQLAPEDHAALLELAEAFADHPDRTRAASLRVELVERFPTRLEVLRRAASLARRAEDKAGALGLLDKAVEVAPDDAGLRRERARARLDEGRYDEALRDLEEARALDPAGVDEAAEAEMLRDHESWREAFTQHGQAVAALARNDYRAAYGHLSEVVSLVPDNPRWLADLADVARIVGEFDEALERFRQLELHDPSDTSARRARADLAYRLGRYDIAAKAYDALIEADGKDLRARLRLLRAYRHRLVERSVQPDLFEALETAYRDHLDRPEGRDRTRLELAHLYLGMGSHLFDSKIWVSAVETHLDAIPEAADDEVRELALRARVELARMTDDGDGLEAWAERWVDGAPADPDAAHVHLAVLYSRGKSRLGREAADRYCRRFPTDGRLHRQWFQFLKQELDGQPAEEAAAAYREQIRSHQTDAAREPREAHRYLRLGLAHLELASRERLLEGLGLASAAFKKAADMDPDSPWPWWGGVLAARAGIAAARGSQSARDRALAAARAATRRFPRDPYLLLELGSLAGEAEDPVLVLEGRRALERSMAQGPRPLPQAAAALGRIREASGDTLEAYHLYLKALEEPEGVPEDRAVLQRLRSLGAT